MSVLEVTVGCGTSLTLTRAPDSMPGAQLSQGIQPEHWLRPERGGRDPEVTLQELPRPGASVIDHAWPQSRAGGTDQLVGNAEFHRGGDGAEAGPWEVGNSLEWGKLRDAKE